MNDFELVNGLADNSLGAEDRARALKRLDEDAHLKAHYEVALATRQALQKDCKGVMCEETWSKCQARMDEFDKSRVVELFVSKHAWKLAASLFFLVAGAGVFQRMNSSSVFHTSDLASVSASMSPLDLSSNRLNWLSDEGGLKVSESRIKLLSYAIGEQGGRKIHQLQVQDAIGPAVITLVENAADVEGAWARNDGEYKYGQVQMLNCVQWQAGKNSVVVMGSRSHQELTQLADRLRAK